MNFTKLHGLGNDYLFINCLDGEPPVDWSDVAVKMSDRRFGVGSDGIILILPSEVADFRMRMFNADGSEGEMCGNGIRCFAKYLWDRGLTDKKIIEVETLAGIIKPALILDGDVVKSVRVDMGRPSLERRDIPVSDSRPGQAINESLRIDGQTLTFTGVSMGNPHAVFFVDDVDKVPLAEIGPKIEHHPLFPKRTNVEFVQVLSDDEMIMRVWERGSGITLACGTGACASAVAAATTGRVGRKVTVHLPGGDLLIEWAENGHVYMTGPCEEVFTGRFSLT